MIWDMETKKAWNPRSYIPYVVSQAHSWGRTSLRDGSTRFFRSSIQRGWITSDEGRVLEDVSVSDAKQTIYFLGRPQMVEEDGNTLVADDDRRNTGGCRRPVLRPFRRPRRVRFLLRARALPYFGDQAETPPSSS